MILKFEEFDKQNEGIKDWALIGGLALTSLFPNLSLAKSNVNAINNEIILTTELKEKVDKEGALIIIKKLRKDGFNNIPGSIPIDIYIDKIVDGDYLIINTLSNTQMSADLYLQYILQTKVGKNYKSIYKLFLNKGTKIELVYIVLL